MFNDSKLHKLGNDLVAAKAHLDQLNQIGCNANSKIEAQKATIADLDANYKLELMSLVHEGSKTDLKYSLEHDAHTFAGRSLIIASMNQANGEVIHV